ncbi:MAG: pilus assembly protein PilP [Gammaproteobacteria bacterium]|nr:pilus assembly protein PilP [Gammaproteobacteria bacterium]NNM00596.1 pilus assembly protein PilP [Gammaproteobacteria bacterium]
MSSSPRRFATVLASGLVLALSGCVSKDYSDLEAYVAEVLEREGGRIDPPPELAVYEPYIYQSGSNGGRNPFVSFLARQEPEIDDKEGAVPVDQQKFVNEISTHKLEELEQYPIDALRMVGTMRNDNNLWGIVLDPTGVTHRVVVGNYLGDNYGKIVSIDEDQIELRELVQETGGRWEERSAALALAEE